MGKIFNALEKYQKERDAAGWKKVKLTSSDWDTLSNYDKKTGHLLKYDSGTGLLDGSRVEILKDNGTIQRLLEYKLIFPGGKLTPRGKKLVEKHKNEPIKKLVEVNGVQNPVLNQTVESKSPDIVDSRPIQGVEAKLKPSNDAVTAVEELEIIDDHSQKGKPEQISGKKDRRQRLPSAALKQVQSPVQKLEESRADSHDQNSTTEIEGAAQPELYAVQKPAEPEILSGNEKIHESLLCLNNSDSFEAEQFKILRTNIMYPLTGSPPRSILVTGANPAEGKSFVATNLAISVALNIDQFVLLIDYDLRKPVIDSRFGLKNQPGLSEYLTDGTPLSSLLVQTEIDKLTILAGGKPPPNPSELLSSDRMSKLLEEVTERYSDRLIIIDSPPPSLTAETGVLARYVEGILLVVKAGQTRQEDLNHMVDKLGKEKIIGSVLNCVDFKSGGYSGYRKYYKYGRYYKK